MPIFVDELKPIFPNEELNIALSHGLKSKNIIRNSSSNTLAAMMDPVWNREQEVLIWMSQNEFSKLIGGFILGDFISFNSDELKTTLLVK